MIPSIVCPRYWRMAHMDHDGGLSGLNIRGFVFRMIFFFVWSKWHLQLMPSPFVANFQSLSLKQSSVKEV